MTKKKDASTAPSTTGQSPRMGLVFPMASEDDPIFSRGFVIGSKRSTRSPAPTPVTPSANKTPKK